MTTAASKNLLSEIQNVNLNDWFYLLGIWWTVTNFGEISGTIAIEMDKGTYPSADGCSTASCNFCALAGGGECTSFYSAILNWKLNGV